LIRSCRCTITLVVVLYAGIVVGCRPTAPVPPRGDQQQPPLKPTGMLAFTSDQTGNRDIYTLNLDTGQTTNVTHTPTNEHFPVWSPHGQRIAFGAANQIFVVNADGRNALQLTRTPGRWEAFSPSWSPDEARLAVASHGFIFSIPTLVTTEGTGWQQLTTLGEDITPVWSPTGDTLAFVSTHDGNADIYTIGRDGSGVRRLTSTPSTEYAPVWSPDGTEITFVSDRSGNTDIYRMHADGTNQIPLTSDQGIDTLPAWSPDGQFIAFTSNRAGTWDIFVMQTDGSNQQPLIQTSASEEYPTWKP